MHARHHGLGAPGASPEPDPQKLAAASVELRHLRGFVSVAEEGNFTRAATRLSMTQPALSRTIAQLERLLDAKLLHRTRHVVEVTPAGERFLVYARRALTVVDEAIHSVQPEVPPIHVSFTYGATVAFVAPMVRAFEQAHPATTVELHRVDDTLAGLGDGRSHIGFLPMAPDDPRIETAVLTHEPRVAAIPVDHPLARRRSLRLRDLQPEPIVINVVSGTTSLDLWEPSQRPTTVVEVHNVEEWLEAVALGRGIGLTPAAAGRLYTHPQICYRRILDAPTVPIVVAWPREGAHPLTAEFVALAAAAQEG